MSANQTFNVHAVDCWIFPTSGIVAKERVLPDGLPMPVIRIAPDGTRQPYPSINAASKSTKTDFASIRRVLTGKRKTAGGSRWEYAKSN